MAPPDRFILFSTTNGVRAAVAVDGGVGWENVRGRDCIVNSESAITDMPGCERPLSTLPHRRGIRAGWSVNQTPMLPGAPHLAPVVRVCYQQGFGPGETGKPRKAVNCSDRVEASQFLWSEDGNECDGVVLTRCSCRTRGHW
jgi:hypothetical protein